MSANSDFLKQLREIQGKSPIQLKALPMPREFVASAQESSISGRVMMVFAAIFAILIALTLIHFFVKPILPTTIVNTRVIPGMNDETLKWSTTGIDATDIPTEPIQNAENPLVTTATQLTVMIDFIIDSPSKNVGKPRVLLYRSPEMASETILSTGTISRGNPAVTINLSILEMIPKYNFIVYADPMTNDVLVGTMIKTEQNLALPSQLTRIYNVPIRKSHRLAIVLLDNIMEVYFNGKLFKTTRTSYPIAPITGQIYGPIKQVKEEYGRVANLRLWKRVLSATEIASYGSGSDFKKVSTK